MAEPRPSGTAGDGTGSRISVKARQLLSRGRAAVQALPDPESLAEMPGEERHELLERLRVELYAISSILAEEAVEHAFADRPERPPYGLVRSGHTDWRMVLASPKTVEAGSIDGFYALGKAYVDTMVFHLDRAFTELRGHEHGWMVERLEGLLALFRVGAGPMTRGRLRDGLSFIYGGLHFGTGVSVQLAEVMNRLLEPYGISPDEKASVMARSNRPAYRFAALNLDHVIVAYHAFLAPPERPGGPQWFDAARFAVSDSDGRPATIDIGAEHIAAGKPHTPRLDTIRPTYATHGCPARISPTGGSPPIARLWTWGVELALQTGLLNS